MWSDKKIWKPCAFQKSGEFTATWRLFSSLGSHKNDLGKPRKRVPVTNDRADVHNTHSKKDMKMCPDVSPHFLKVVKSLSYQNKDNRYCFSEGIQDIIAAIGRRQNTICWNASKGVVEIQPEVQGKERTHRWCGKRCWDTCPDQMQKKNRELAHIACGCVAWYSRLICTCKSLAR